MTRVHCNVGKQGNNEISKMPVTHLYFGLQISTSYSATNKCQIYLLKTLRHEHYLCQANDLILAIDKQTWTIQQQVGYNILWLREMKNYIIKVKYGDPVLSQFQVNSHTFHRELLLHEFCSNCKMFCVKIIPFLFFEYLKFDKTKIGNKCYNYSFHEMYVKTCKYVFQKPTKSKELKTL